MNSPFYKPLGFVFATVTLIQAVTWFILSLLGILYYLGAIKNINSFSFHISMMTEIILFLYFDGSVNDDSHFFKSSKVHICMWFYLFLSIFWAFSSATHLILSAKESTKYKVQRISTITLVSLTFVMCIFDFIVTALFGADYDDIAAKTKESGQDYVLVIIGVMMAIAARGFVLWIINFFFSVTMSRILHQTKDGPSPFNKRTHSPTPNFNSAYDDLNDTNSLNEEPRQPTSWLAKLNAERYGLGREAAAGPAPHQQGPREDGRWVYAGHHANSPYAEGPSSSHGWQDDYSRPPRTDRPVPPFKPTIRRNQYD